MAIPTDPDIVPTRQALAIPGRSKKFKVTGKLRVAMDNLFLGKERAEAAKLAGLTDHSLRTALLKPHVRQYYMQEMQVLKTSARIRAYQRLIEISEQSVNLNAAVVAAKALIAEEQQLVGASYVRNSPGITIVIESGKPEPNIIDHEPTGHEP